MTMAVNCYQCAAGSGGCSDPFNKTGTGVSTTGTDKNYAYCKVKLSYRSFSSALYFVEIGHGRCCTTYWWNDMWCVKIRSQLWHSLLWNRSLQYSTDSFSNVEYFHHQFLLSHFRENSMVLNNIVSVKLFPINTKTFFLSFNLNLIGWYEKRDLYATVKRKRGGVYFEINWKMVMIQTKIWPQFILFFFGQRNLSFSWPIDQCLHSQLMIHKIELNVVYFSKVLTFMKQTIRHVERRWSLQHPIINYMKKKTNI